MGKAGKHKSDGGSSQPFARNTSSHVQVLGWGTDTLSGALPSLQLFFDTTRLLFNCGEGLQRLSGDSNVRSMPHGGSALPPVRSCAALRAVRASLMFCSHQLRVQRQEGRRGARVRRQRK
jgi:hypothetical protein